jgi:hypothetical protein
MDPLQNDAGTDDGDSPVIKGMRSQIDNLEKALKASNTKADTAVADANAQVERKQDASKFLNDELKGLADVVAGEVDGDITEESVGTWLSERKLGDVVKQSSDGADDGADDGASSDDKSKASDVAGVADLGSSVAATNVDSDQRNFTARVDALEEDHVGSLEAFADGLAEIVEAQKG